MGTEKNHLNETIYVNSEEKENNYNFTLSMFANFLPIQIKVGNYFSLHLNPNLCCGYSKESPQIDVSFKHSKIYMLTLYLIETPFNAFLKQSRPRSGSSKKESGSTLFAYILI